jgi:6-phosphogluconolactonase/glucosamine-6-phosphate isomerase/deaminase
MEARQVILVVNGSKKASIVKQVLEGKISEELPASLMRNHKHFTVYLDAAAARYLQAE